MTIQISAGVASTSFDSCSALIFARAHAMITDQASLTIFDAQLAA